MLLKDTAGNFVIAFRGTESDKWKEWAGAADLLTDASMTFTGFTEQMKLALFFVKTALNQYAGDGLSINNLTFT